MYIVGIGAMTLVPDTWLWHIGVGEWPLPLAILWWIPSLLIILAEVGLQLGKFHRISVRVLFSLILFSVMPKVVFILFEFLMPWFFAILPALAVMGWFLYGFVEGWKRLEVKYVTYSSADLPPYFDGYKILHFTDLHLGTFPKGADFVRKVVERANAEGVEMMLFTGDLVNNAADEVEPYVEDLKKLHAPDGIFSVWGNHDYCEYNTNHSLSALRKNRRLLFQLQNEMGWHQLMNEHFTVSHGMASIEIIGVENAGQPPFTNRSNLKKAMKGVAKDAFKIVLTHDPHHWRREVQKTGVHLTLAGHTHAGQLKIGNFTPAHMAFKEWGGEYWLGRQLLYVSAGLGGSFPFRLGAWPEMTVITLKRDLG
ncbi:MAG: metallophosphoesterase [Prevotella copri]|nr:metallophosphoesterase [Segatella copri]MDY6204709.1 metallophosphoesterase [Segatella copri]